MIQISTKFIPLFVAVAAVQYVYSKAQKFPDCANYCIRAGLAMTTCPPNQVDCLCKDTDVFLFNVYDCVASREYCKTDAEISQSIAYAHALCASHGIILPADPFKEFGITTGPTGAVPVIETPLITSTSSADFYVSTIHVLTTIKTFGYGSTTYVIPMYTVADCAAIELRPIQTVSLKKKKHLVPLLPPAPEFLPRDHEDTSVSATLVTATVLRSVTPKPSAPLHEDGVTGVNPSATHSVLTRHHSDFDQCIINTNITKTITFSYLIEITSLVPHNTTTLQSATMLATATATEATLPANLATGCGASLGQCSLFALIMFFLIVSAPF